MGRPGTFKPGQSGNPAGRSKKDHELRALKQMNLQEFSEWTQKLWRSNTTELEEILSDKSHHHFVRMLAKIFMKIAEGGSAKELSHLLPYIVGKPKENVAHEFPDPTVIHLPGGAKLELGVKQGGQDAQPSGDAGDPADSEA